MNSINHRVVQVVWKRAGLFTDDLEVWVSVEKIEANWRADGEDYIGRNGVGAAKPGAYEGFSAWVQSGQPVEMPEVTIYEGRIQFSNGRHRFAFFRDHGMTAMQVQTDPADIELFKKMFGTTERSSVWLRPVSTST